MDIVIVDTGGRMAPRSITPAMFQILVALAGGPRHGYGIMLELEDLTGDPLGPATLYRSIRQLLDAGLIEETDGHDSMDERRRYYRLTSTGAEVATDEASRLDAILKRARKAGLVAGKPRFQGAQR